MWLDSAYLCITDASGKRRRNVELLDGRLISELPRHYHVTRMEIDEEFRRLWLELHAQVIPDLESSSPDSVSAFRKLGKRLHALRKAIGRPGSAGDGLQTAYEALTRIAEIRIQVLRSARERSKALQRSQILPPAQTPNQRAANRWLTFGPEAPLGLLDEICYAVEPMACPGCDESYEDPESFRVHFLAEHRPPDRQAEIAKAVGKCRAAWTEADQAVRRGVEPSSPEKTPTAALETDVERETPLSDAAPSSPAWGRGRPSLKAEIVTEYKRRVQAYDARGEAEPTVLEFAESLRKWAEQKLANKGIRIPSVRTIQDYIYGCRKSQEASPKSP